MGKKTKRPSASVSGKCKEGEHEPLPEGFLRQMKEFIGETEARELASALDRPPAVSIRLNRRKADMRSIPEGLKPVAWCPSGYYLDERPDFVHDPLLHAGVYYVQEAASMIYETMAGEIAGKLDAEGNHLKVLDLCAAPGGKSTAILNGLAGHDYILVANEYDRKRVQILKENLDKWGDPKVVVTNSSTDVFRGLGEYFDLVTVDAPCSGEGMMRREPLARTQWSERLVEQCADLQRDILANAIEVLKPGGYLIYSTCTFNRMENEENAFWLKEKLGLESIGEPRRFYPHRNTCEGFFVAVFRKPGEFQPGSFQDLEKVTGKLRKSGIRIVGAGTEKSVRKGDMEVPSSRRVLAYDYDRSSYPEVELGLEDAVAYLKRNTVVLPQGTPVGYVTVTYRGHPLGLVKNIGNRANNLYPAEWRILT